MKKTIYAQITKKLIFISQSAYVNIPADWLGMLERNNLGLLHEEKPGEYVVMLRLAANKKGQLYFDGFLQRVVNGNGEQDKHRATD